MAKKHKNKTEEKPAYDPNGSIYVGIPRERLYIPWFVDNRDAILSSLYSDGRGSGMFQSEGHRVDRNRDRIVEAFLEHTNMDGTKPPWLLMVDSDMDHPPNVGQRLARWGKPIVGGLYFHRGSQHEPFVFQMSKKKKDRWNRMTQQWVSQRDLVYDFLDKHNVPMLDGHLLIEETEDSPLIECDAVGTGSILIHRSVLESMPGPWFEYRQGGNSEDLVFCKEAKEAGYPIYCDISIISGHYHWVPLGQSQFRSLYQKRGYDLSGYSKEDAARWLKDFLLVDEKEAQEYVNNPEGHVVDKVWNEWFSDREPTPELIKEFYESDEVGKAYIKELLSWNVSQAFKFLKSQLIKIREKNIVDIGAGIGSIAIQLTIQCNDVIAIEPNALLRKMIVRRYNEMTEYNPFRKGDLEVWDSWIGKLDDSSVDIITAFDVFEHLPLEVLKSYLEEAHRVLRKGGRVIYHNNFKQQDIFPMHFDYSDIWTDTIHQMSFKTLTDMELIKIS